MSGGGDTRRVAMRYVPALDGLRGAAVVAVVAFHFGWLPGGWLGVDAFFTL
jgi:peptidoglycan/LPS O-acetylase OafA/YrhL